MRAIVSYPPRAYPNMPYLAPFLLKGHIESTTSHRVFADDLNIDYHLHLWQRAPAEQAAAELFAAGDLGHGVAAELVAQEASNAWHALRSIATYDDAGAVWRNARLLRLAGRVADAVDAARGTSLPLVPDALEGWTAIVDRCAHSVVGQFIAAEVARGRFDDADVIGLSVAYVPQLLPALLLAARVKERRPDVPIVLGGGGVTHFFDDLVRDTSFWRHVDYVVPFEGEYSFGQLLDRIEAAEGAPTHVAWFDGARVVYRKGLSPRPKVQAAPDYSDLVHRYPTPAPIYSLLTSKGCYWGKCTFCTHHESYGDGYWPFSNGQVQSSLQHLIDGGARYFYFVDEALPPRMLSELATVFEAARTTLGTDELGWMAEARMEKVLVRTPAAKLLRRSGCKLLVNGIESGCQAIVDAMKKGIDLALVEQFARECHEERIRTGWMFFIGYPGETPAQARETFAFIERNAAAIDFASVGVFALERGSPLWLQPEAAGITDVGDRDRPYRVTYSFADADGPYDYDEHGAELAALHREFAHLAPLFEGVGDRALALFLPEAPASSPRAGRFEWRSPRLGKQVAFELRGQRVEIHP